jgi:hypothetical protein
MRSRRTQLQNVVAQLGNFLRRSLPTGTALPGPVRAERLRCSSRFPRLRRHLEEFGHGYKLSEIKEALNVLSGTMLEISLAEEQVTSPPRGGKWKPAAPFCKGHDFEQLRG